MKRRAKRYQHPTLFISGNVAHRVPLFQLWPRANAIFIQTLDFYRRKYRFLLHGYVVMPDHYHLLLTVQPGTSLVDLLRDFKSYVGKETVRGLRRANHTKVLERFHLSTPVRRRKDLRYHVLQSDNDIVEVFSPAILRRKLQYMHANPVKKGLVAQIADWKYSSWRAYESGEPSPLAVDRIEF